MRGETLRPLTLRAFVGAYPPCQGGGYAKLGPSAGHHHAGRDPEAGQVGRTKDTDSARGGHNRDPDRIFFWVEARTSGAIPSRGVVGDGQVAEDAGVRRTYRRQSARTHAAMSAPVRKAPPSRPRAAVPTAQLVAEPNPWLRDAVLLAAAAVIIWSAAPLVGQAQWALPATILAVVAALLRAVLGKRTSQRAQLMDRVTEAVCPMVGVRTANRAVVRASRWRRGWPGTPGIIDVRYPSGTPDTEPGWASEVAEAVSRRMPHPFRIDSHDRMKCQLRLTPTPPEAETAAVPAEVVRAERLILELLGPTAAITNTEVTGGELRSIDARHEAGAKLAASGYRNRVEKVVSTNLPGRWRAQWDLEADTVHLEVRPTFPANLWLPVPEIDETIDVLDTYDDVELSYGVDEDRNPVVWRPARDPNLMLVGAPGTGKTATAHTLLALATLRGWPVWVVDGKAIEFLGFQDWPNVQVVASVIEQQIAVIHRAHAVMEHRYNLITTGRAKESDFEPLLVFLDEYADFRGNLMAWYTDIKVKGDPTKPPVLQRVQSIARKGRTSRVHLVFATQRPDAEYFGGDMRDNFRMRISMGRLSPQGAMMMWESAITGTTIPRGCRGRATTVNDANRAVEIQNYYTPDPRKTPPGTEGYELLQQLRPATTKHERLLILDPEPQPDLDGKGDTSEPVAPTYTDYAEADWVLASQFPHLDPVNHRARGITGGRAAASPMALFGLTNADSPVSMDKPAPTSAHDATPEPAAPTDDADIESEGDEWEGYGLVMDITPEELQVGDLILVDDAAGLWGVVDDEPEPDVEDDDCIAVSWRGDDDSAGAVSLPCGYAVSARRPVEFED